MRCSLPQTTAASLPRPNMTAPEDNFCCATDLAPMSGPGAFGVGIIGIVSYEPAAPATRIQTSYPFGHIYRSVLNSGRIWVNPLLGRRRGLWRRFIGICRLHAVK